MKEQPFKLAKDLSIRTIFNGYYTELEISFKADLQTAKPLLERLSRYVDELIEDDKKDVERR